jgi:hypothetical protein
LDDIAERLGNLLIDPKERLDVEIKGWLDFKGNKNHKADLAKALIALANHGGGYVILGFEEKNSVYEPTTPRSENVKQYNQDAINGIAEHYAEPSFHCEVHIETRPGTQDTYPIIRVPGGSVPIRSRSESPDHKTLLLNVYYIRRNGPKSEPPQSAQEWDALLQRCVLAKRADMLNAIRGIVLGVSGGGVENKSPMDELEKWEKSCLERWQEVVKVLPENDPACSPLGYYSYSYEIDGNYSDISFRELLEKMSRVPRHSGWPPFCTPLNFQPSPNENAIECWFDPRKALELSPMHLDFWRASNHGQLFLIRGYQEDNEWPSVYTPGRPGSIFYFTLPIWRVGECLLHASNLAEQFGMNEASIRYKFTWTGLVGRTLTARANENYFSPGGIAQQPELQRTGEVTTSKIRDNLPEVVFGILRPLYELFRLFELPLQTVQREIDHMLPRA